MEPSQNAPQPEKAKKQGRGGLVIGLVVLLAALAGAGYVHYNGATDTVKGYFNDSLVTFNASSAYNRICTDAKDRPASAAELQQELDAVKTLGAFDISKATYTLQGGNFFSEASVKLGGTIKGTVAGISTDVPLSGTVTLKSSGFGWCISGGTSTGIGFSAGNRGVVSLARTSSESA